MKKRPLRVLLTAGPTHEYLDPVRFLTNPSTGAMGMAIAMVFQKNGAQVTVVCGPISFPSSKGITVRQVTSAKEMMEAVKSEASKADIFVGTAAVSDYRFARKAKQKIKKSQDSLTLTLRKNPDILSWFGHHKKANQVSVGFALETNRVERESQKKQKQKNADLVIGNKPLTFGSSLIHPYWLEKRQKGVWLPKQSKQQLAKRIAKWAKTKFNSTI